MDVLGDAVAVMRTGRPVSARLAWRAPWGQRFATVPGAAGIQVVLRGECWLIPDAGPPVHLAAGDVLLMPHGRGHALADSPATPLRPCPAPTPPLPLSPPPAADPDGVVLCGAYELQPDRAHPLLDDLPHLVHLRAHPQLRPVIDLLGAELERHGGGTEVGVSALLDLLFLNALRAYFETPTPFGNHRGPVAGEGPTGRSAGEGSSGRGAGGGPTGRGAGGGPTGRGAGGGPTGRGAGGGPTGRGAGGGPTGRSAGEGSSGRGFGGGPTGRGAGEGPIGRGAEEGPAFTGWAAALRDPAVGAALTAIHREPNRSWTVAELAAVGGLSRAPFARRFSSLTGRAPLSYLTWWRMTLAARLLRGSDVPLRTVAHRVGYASEFAFAAAFKRRFGVAPGRFRRAA